MTNKAISQQFSLLADLLEIIGENPFKIKSYTNAAVTIKYWPAALFDLTDEHLYRIPGVGQAIGEKVRELQQKGSIAALEHATSSIPSGVREMMKVHGISAKKIGVIWRALGTETIEDLEQAAQENRIAPIKGFGEKTQNAILEALAFYKDHLGYSLWANAEILANELVNNLKIAFPSSKFEFAGAFRRQEDILSSIDFVADAPENLVQEWLMERGFIGQGGLENNQNSYARENWPTLNITFSSESLFYYHQFLATGTPEFLAAFPETDPDSYHSLKEEELFAKAGMAFIPAPLRMTPDWIPHALNNDLPPLINITDIKGIIHSHSDYSDGGATLSEMATAARDKGFEYLVISDHSQAAQYARGLYPDKIVRQHGEIESLNAKLAPFKIFKSIEADILGDGKLDYNANVLSSFDLVIASVHSTLKMTEDKAISRLLKAIENPFTAILGHLTGRLLLRRAGYPVNHKKIIDACAANKVVIEINANPRRLDMDWKWIPYAMDSGVMLSINPDAHSVAGMNDIAYGVRAAQKGGLIARHNLSSLSLTDFEDYLKEYHKKR